MNPYIEWNGGECPVPADVMVRYDTRSRGSFYSLAGELEWGHGTEWPDSEIIRYQVWLIAPETPPEEPEDISHISISHEAAQAELRRAVASWPDGRFPPAMEAMYQLFKTRLRNEEK